MGGNERRRPATIRITKMILVMTMILSFASETAAPAHAAD